MAKAVRYFGTDGIRGKVGQVPITVDFILKLGWAAGRVLQSQGGGKVIVGKDTRISGYMLESALQAGLTAAGIDVYLLGSIPTPAISYLTHTLGAQAGVVISASHNRYDDNGIKFFSAEGTKLPDEMEAAIEEELQNDINMEASANLGKLYRVKDARSRYIEFCKSSVPHHTNFTGITIVLDCANGATFHVAPLVFRELGAKVIEFNTNPNGLNINDNCGSTCPEMLQKYVLQEHADIGIAFDGDGDRVIMVDDKGEIVDGDELLFIIVKNYLKAHGTMGGVIGTQMSNMGLELALKDTGVNFKRVQVGDRNVMLGLKQEKWVIGGEPSGHIICLEIANTGDGIVSALQVLHAMSEMGMSLHTLKAGMRKFPQMTINVPCNGVGFPLDDPQVKHAIEAAEAKLQNRGRVLLRASGTEPVIRVMVEGEQVMQVKKLTEDLAQLVATVVQR